MDDWRGLLSGSDVRGCASPNEGESARLTADMAAKLACAFAMWLAKRLDTTPDKLAIAVGRDSRESGSELAAAVTRGLTAADCDVYDCGLCATPAMLLITVSNESRADGAIMLTGGRLHWRENGMKFITRGGSPREEETAEIIARASALSLPQRLVTKLDFTAAYRDYLAAMARRRLEDDAKCPLLGMHVVVDAAGGTGGFFAGFLEDLGAYVDGSRRLAPEARSEQEGVDALSRAVLENEADIGVLFDADCQRAVFVDEKGRAISGNRLIALMAAILLEETPGATIVTDSVTSSGVARFITEWSGVHYRFKRGFRNAIEEAVRLSEEGIDCPLAITTTGHAALRENYFHDDGVYLATRIICRLMDLKRDGKTLASLTEELSEPVESVELRLRLLADDYRTAAQEVIEMVLSHTLDDTSWHLARDNREGARICFDLDGGVDNAWFLLRLSSRERVMPLYAESDIPGGVKRMLSGLKELMEGAASLDLEQLNEYVNN